MNNLRLTVHRCGEVTDAEGCDSHASQTLRLHLCLRQSCRFPHRLIWNPSGVSLQIIKNQTTGNCSAGVLFDRSGERRSAQVQASCEELLKVDTLPQEEAFYQQCKTNGSMSAQNLPGELNRSRMSCCSKAHIVTPLTTPDIALRSPWHLDDFLNDRQPRTHRPRYDAAVALGHGGLQLHYAERIHWRHPVQHGSGGQHHPAGRLPQLVLTPHVHTRLFELS